MESISLDTHVVLWGYHDQNFHSETLREYIASNQECYFQGRPSIYSLLALAKSKDHAAELIEKLKAKKQNTCE